MNRYLLHSLIVVAAVLQAAGSPKATLAAPPLCSDAWYRAIEGKVPSGDGQGHGPDVGSEEWKSVIEFKLGVRGQPNVPKRDSEGWCRFIDQLVNERGLATGPIGSPPGAVPGQGPSYACDKVQPGSIEALICEDKALSALDRKLSGVYAAASKQAADERPPRLKAEQRGWIKGRDECWKSGDKGRCVQEAYLRRIAELQARYRLVPADGPVLYACDGNPADEVVATFFQTEPRTLIAERGDSVSLMFIQPGDSGAKYQGRNETFWEHQGETLIQWGYGAPEMRCTRKR